MTMANSLTSPHFHAYRVNNLQIRRKLNNSLLFPTTLLSSLPSTSSFPITINSPSNPIQFHLLSDSIHDNFIEDLENSLNQCAPVVNGVHPCPRIFIQDPPWISSLFLKGLYKKNDLELKLEFKEIEKRKYNLLRRRQIKAETEAWERMVEEYRELEREMREKSLAPNLPHVKALFLGWFDPLREAIEREQKSQMSKKKKAAYASFIDLLPAAKMALIVMHKMMGLLMLEQEAGCVQVVQAAIQIGMAIEEEGPTMGVKTLYSSNAS